MATHFVNGVKLKIVPASGVGGGGGGVLWAGWQCRRSIGISRLRKRDRLSAGWIELVTRAKEKRLQRGYERERERESVLPSNLPINRFPLPFRDCTTTVFHGIFEDVVERVHGFLRINLITIFFTIFYVFYIRQYSLSGNKICLNIRSHL